MVEQPQIPVSGPLCILNEESDWTRVSENLTYGGQQNLRKSFRIPIELLHFNIENGRYHTKFLLLQQAHPGENIDPTQPLWKDEILKLLNGTWVDNKTGVSTYSDRDYFLQLVEDLRVRGQERPGLVLENGGVMGGNRRLAALITLAIERNDPKFQRFEAFIVPGNMDAADRWRLEVSAQMGATRLIRDYDSVERLVKIRQGVDLLKAKSGLGEDTAIRGVAADFGLKPDDVKQELLTYSAILEWLDFTGHSGELWRADNLTEIFTEVPGVFDTAKKAGMSLQDQSSLKRTVFNLISNKAADYRLIRQIRTAIGMGKRSGISTGVPTAIELLIKNAPAATELKNPPSHEAEDTAEELADRFRADVESKKAQRTPLVLAQTAETNLESLVNILKKSPIASDKKLDVLKSVKKTLELAEEAISKLSG